MPMARYADTGSYTEEENAFWEKLLRMEGRRFVTLTGLEYGFTARGNELFFDRREKSVTRATVIAAYRRAIELNGVVPGPRSLGTFGASYLYPIFLAAGLIDVPASEDAAAARKKARYEKRKKPGPGQQSL